MSLTVTSLFCIKFYKLTAIAVMMIARAKSDNGTPIMSILMAIIERHRNIKELD